MVRFGLLIYLSWQTTQSYPVGLQNPEKERDSYREKLGAEVLRPDGGEVAEEAEGELGPAELLGPTERLQPGVQPPADAWSQIRDLLHTAV